MELLAGTVFTLRRNLIATVLMIFEMGTFSVRAETPELLRRKEFSSETLVRAANYYIGLGEYRAIEELKGLERDLEGSVPVNISLNERIAWICRIVFKRKPGKPLRAPMFGALRLPYRTMPLEKWPLYPVAEAEGVFFVLSEGYMLHGRAELVSSYIDYCRRNGMFRKLQLKVPTREEAQSAFQTLKMASRWDSVRWRHAGGLVDEVRVFREIEKQALAVSREARRPMYYRYPVLIEET